MINEINEIAHGDRVSAGALHPMPHGMEQRGRRRSRRILSGRRAGAWIG
jgi:hypothetical protein